MNIISQTGDPRRGGFTLLEMMASTAVLVLMVAMLAPVFSAATFSTSNSGEKLGIDVLARQALDRIGWDLSLMPQREDLDYYLKKLDGNDEFVFYSSVPGVLLDNTDPSSGVTLVGYRVVNGNLERMAIAQGFDSLRFLAYDSSNALVEETSITNAITSTADDNYHVLCEGVFRFELGFLLKDGSYQPLPMDESNDSGVQTDVGNREWFGDPASSAVEPSFAGRYAPDGVSGTVLRPLGWQDVAAIVVTIAVIDEVGAARATTAGLETAAANLDDAVESTTPSTLVLPAENWRQTLDTPESLGIPQPLQNSVEIYQRSFYLNNL
jgi:type II secretory pathway pseudopilin PulG